ncbi:hypothetical protein Bca52824_035566 [Brassica carinata]|uniref:Uncharacterized protein n=1 Tax=Brassica carinata TaxID=52824 RepID=A0A8X7S7T4_BRACI|nr:hypothetical protein Bca52824_035566 [Brassica carinata]
MKKSITRLQEQRTNDTGTLTSIYNQTRILIENMFEQVKTCLRRIEESLDGICYPVNKEEDGLTSIMDAQQQEVDTIQKQLDFQAEIVSSIDMDNHPSIDRRFMALEGQMKLFVRSFTRSFRHKID